MSDREDVANGNRDRFAAGAAESRFAPIGAGLALGLFALAAYHRSFSGIQFFDDVDSITHNPSIRHLGALTDVLSPPANGTTVSGRPLLNLTFAINYAFGGDRIWGYHLGNLVVHVLAGLILFGVVRRILRLPFLRARFGQDATWLGLAVATLWTLDPVQTESVTYISQRAESLVGFFYLLTLYAFVRGVEDGVKRSWLGASVVACWLGAGSKEVIVTAPLMILLFDRTFVAGGFRAALSRRWRFYLGLATAFLPLGYLLAKTGGNRAGTVGFDIGVPFAKYWMTQAEALSRYTWLSVWPHPLIFDYGTHWFHSLNEVLPYACVVTVLVLGTWFALIYRPIIGFCGGWFFGVLALTSLVPGAVQLVVEHRVYLSLAAPLGLLVAGVYHWLGPRSWLVFGLIGLAFGWLTNARNLTYQSEVAIWSDTVAKRPDNERAHFALGAALNRVGQEDAALVEFETAVRLNPRYAAAYNSLGNARKHLGQPEAARASYEQALSLEPLNPTFHFNLALALDALGRTGEAIPHLKLVMAQHPADVEARTRLAEAEVRVGERSDALAQLREVLRLQPGSAETLNSLGALLEQMGQRQEAIAQFNAAIAARPDFGGAHKNLGILLEQNGQSNEAIMHYRRAEQLLPDDGEICDKLGTLLAEIGEVDEAMALFERALRLSPDDCDARTNLGVALLGRGRRAEALVQFEAVVQLNPNYPGASEKVAALRESLRSARP